MKKILVIGATSTIAIACARLWAARGAALFLVGRNNEKLSAVSSDLLVRGAHAAHTYQLDLNEVTGHEAMLVAAASSLGEFDIALIAHGTLPDQAACERDPELTIREFSTNATSTLSLITGLANRFEQQRKGALAVITSVAGDRGRPTNYVYGSAKAAVSVFCEGLRARLFKAGVTLTDIRPGFVATAMTQDLQLPAALVAQPEDVARRIVRGIDRGSDVLYAPAFWFLIMGIIKSIPRTLFKRLTL